MEKTNNFLNTITYIICIQPYLISGNDLRDINALPRGEKPTIGASLSSNQTPKEENSIKNVLGDDLNTKPDRYRTFVTGANYVSIGLSLLTCSVILGLPIPPLLKDFKSFTDFNNDFLPYVAFAAITTLPETLLSSRQSAHSDDNRNLYGRNVTFFIKNAILSVLWTHATETTMPIQLLTVSFGVKAAVNLINIVYKATRQKEKV